MFFLGEDFHKPTEEILIHFLSLSEVAQTLICSEFCFQYLRAFDWDWKINF